jgi:hypothetical protein
MKIITFIVMALFLFSISGCKLTGIKGEVKGVEIEAKEAGSDKDKKESSVFCPPGQAKKGNC